jgi:hypothetical protein
MQYLFQCKCPAHSESLRYPQNVEIVISACQVQDDQVSLSPQGTLLDINQDYLYDLRTGERLSTPAEKPFIVLTDTLFFYNTPDPYIQDAKNKSRYPVELLANFPVSADGKIDVSGILPILNQASAVYLLGDYILIEDGTKYYRVYESALTGESAGGQAAQRFLNINHIPFEASFQFFPGELPSHNGKFIEKWDGIYSAATNERIVNNFHSPSSRYFEILGWQYDDEGVILGNGNAYLLEFPIGLPGLDSSQMRYFRVPQPVLLLKVPSDYLSPTPSP